MDKDPKFRIYLGLFFKVSLFLFIISMCCELVLTANVTVQTTTPAYDLNAKLGKLHTLGSSSVGFGTQALQNEEPPLLSIDNMRQRQLAFQGQFPQSTLRKPNPFYREFYLFGVDFYKW